MSLQIDFAPSSKPRVPVRLGIGAIMLVLILALTWSVTSETEAGLPPNNKLMPGADEIRRMNSAIDDLNFPWLAILTSVEQSTDDYLRLHHLDADGRDRRMTIRGEASNGNAVLAFSERLRASPAIADARITSQSPASSSETAGFPVRFALEVSIHAAEEEKP